MFGKDPEDASLGTYTYRCKGCNGKYCNECNFGDMWEPAKNIVTIKRINDDGTITELNVDWDKMPCSKCEWRYSFHCPHGCWNEKGKYIVY